MLERIKYKVLAGERISANEAIELFETDDIFTLGNIASHVAEKKNGKKVFFIRNRHINPTNICVNRCKFCAFSRSKGEEGAYEMTLDEIIHKLLTFNSQLSTPFSEVHVVGGLHPDWPFGYYLEMLSSIKKRSEEHTSELQSRLHLV